MSVRKKIIFAASFAVLFAASSVLCGAAMWSGRDGIEGQREEGKGTEAVSRRTAAGTASEEADAGEPVIVIDAGHGGKDGGASAPDGTSEKDINLRIALMLAEITEGYPVRTVLTRKDDSAVLNGEGYSKRKDLLNRRKIIEDAEPALTVSIHLNSFPDDETVCGPQVFYAESQRERTDGRSGEQTSKAYAESVQKALKNRLSGVKARVVKKKNDVLLLREPTFPIILVECGFLSNKVECERLKDAEYQREIALAVWEGVNEILCLERKNSTDIIESTNRTK